MSEVFLEVLKPTFMTLSDLKLLQKYVLGTTQNPSGYVNSMDRLAIPGGTCTREGAYVRDGKRLKV